jgi:hypothetical protein
MDTCAWNAAKPGKYLWTIHSGMSKLGRRCFGEGSSYGTDSRSTERFCQGRK